jgi:hypothetical protein
VEKLKMRMGRLTNQMNEIREIVTDQIKDVVNGRSFKTKHDILTGYMSESLNIDHKGIEVLSNVVKCLYKCKHARKLLHRFYADPSTGSFSNPTLAKDVHVLAKDILQQENYIRRIQNGYLNMDEKNNIFGMVFNIKYY